MKTTFPSTVKDPEDLGSGKRCGRDPGCRGPKGRTNTDRGHGRTPPLLQVERRVVYGESLKCSLVGTRQKVPGDVPTKEVDQVRTNVKGWRPSTVSIGLRFTRC